MPNIVFFIDGKAIKDYIAEKGKTRSSVATKMGISSMHLGMMIVNGTMSELYYDLLIKALGVQYGTFRIEQLKLDLEIEDEPVDEISARDLLIQFNEKMEKLIAQNEALLAQSKQTPHDICEIKFLLQDILELKHG